MTTDITELALLVSKAKASVFTPNIFPSLNLLILTPMTLICG